MDIEKIFLPIGRELKMETRKEKREDVVKILQMVENGIIDENDAKCMLNALADIKSRLPVKSAGEHLARSILGVTFISVSIYGLIFYLPTHVGVSSLLIVYGFIGLLVICVTMVSLMALGVGRKAVDIGHHAVKLKHNSDFVETT